MGRDLGVLGDSLNGVERLLTDGGILLVGELLLQSLDSPKRKSHVRANSPKIWTIFVGAATALEKFDRDLCSNAKRPTGTGSIATRTKPGFK